MYQYGLLECKLINKMPSIYNEICSVQKADEVNDIF